MKFFCEYCGYRIDADEDEKCPNCGASYKKNKTFIRLEEEKKQQEINDNKLKEEVRQFTFKNIKFIKWFFLFFIIIFIVVFVSILVSATGMFKVFKNNKIEEKIINIIDEDKEEKQPEKEIEEKKEPEAIIVDGLNNYGSIDEYKFMVTGYKVVKSKWPDDYTGENECVKFYFQVQNTSGKEIRKQEVNCIVDGVAQKQSMFGSNTMTYSIGKDLTVKGDMEFMVPKNATSYDIKYGDYITIHIEK